MKQHNQQNYNNPFPNYNMPQPCNNINYNYNHTNMNPQPINFNPALNNYAYNGVPNNNLGYNNFLPSTRTI